MTALYREHLARGDLLKYKFESSTSMNLKQFQVFGALVMAAVFLSIPAMGLAAGQTMPGMTEVSGDYTNEANGVEISFPDGWSGFEIATGETLMVVTAPGGMSEAEVTKSITLIITDKTNRDPRDPSSFSQESIDCPNPAAKSVTVAGVQGYEVVVECPSTATMMKMVSVGTEDKWVVVMYMSPTSEFNRDVGRFDSAVNTLRVDGAVDVEGTTDADDETNLGQELKSVIQSVLVKGKNMDMALKTTSTISNFMLEEQNKQLKFTVDGQSGTEGTTEIPIGQVLEGPYAVAVDGQATTDFEVTNEGTSNAMMKISYMHSIHEITVTGTNVVPEFPAVMIGVIVAVIGVVAVIGRTSLIGRK